MEPVVPTPAPETPSAAPPPATEMPPVQPAAPPPQQPMYNTGGAAPAPGNAFTRFFDGITFSDVVIYGLLFLIMFMMIDYYRKKLKQLRDDKVASTALQSKVDEVEMNLKVMMGDNYKSSA